MRKNLRRALLLLNLGFVVVFIRLTESSGLGFYTAKQWAPVSSLIGYVHLTWQMGCRRVKVEGLSLQSLGLLVICHVAEVFGYSRYTFDAVGIPMTEALAVTALLAFGFAYRDASLCTSGDNDTDSQSSEPVPFGAELLRRFYTPITSRQRQLAMVPEHAILPVLALVAGMLLWLITPVDVWKEDIDAGRNPFVASWHQCLEAMALLPQFQKLYLLRESSECSDGVAVMPMALRKWMVSLAVGHLFASISAVASSFGDGETRQVAMMYAGGEAINSVLFSELFYAHMKAKWLGEREMILPA